MTILSLLIGAVMFRPKAAAQTLDASLQSNTQNNPDYVSEDITIKNNAIQTRTPVPSGTGSSHINGSGQSPSGNSGRHRTRAETQISETALRSYLESKGSPLANYSTQILASPYWSTIIGICTIEQYGCSHAPYNNYWGLMKRGGGLQHFATLEAGIAAIDAFLAKGEDLHPTIESMRGWYCASACTSWEPTVIKTKLLIESL